MPFKKAKEKETEPKKMEKKKEKKGKLEKSKKEKTPENQGEVLLEKKTNGIITNEIELLDKEIESKQQGFFLKKQFVTFKFFSETYFSQLKRTRETVRTYSGIIK